MPEHLSFEEQRAVDGAKLFLGDDNGYSRQQATRPQTIGYALSDSPAGQAMWIYESFTVGLTTTALLKTRCRGIRCWTTFHSTGSQTPRHRRHGSTGRTKAPHFQEASSPCLWPQPSFRERYIVLQTAGPSRPIRISFTGTRLSTAAISPRSNSRTFLSRKCAPRFEN